MKKLLQRYIKIYTQKADKLWNSQDELRDYKKIQAYEHHINRLKLLIWGSNYIATYKPLIRIIK